MTEEKQIEEIYKVIMEAELGFPKANLPLLDIERYIAEALYNAGYRKQSEWISVEERLPDNCRAVLVALEGLTIGGAPAMVIGSYSGGFWMIADADGTHYLTKYMRCVVTRWMPLPEPPKGV
jgi:hypothetical protein